MKKHSSSHRLQISLTSLSTIGKSLIVGLVISCLLLITASPIHAWWFDSAKPDRSVTPTHQSGLVLSPIIKSVIPQFILEPLVVEEVEVPPTVEATPTPTSNSVVITPITPAPTTTPEPKSAIKQTSIAEEMLKAVNNERSRHGLRALRLNTQLSNSAQAYAVKMQQLNFFSHTGPNGDSLRERNEAAGYTSWRWMGENIAYGQTSVDEVVTAWMNSKDHRENILSSDAQELGVGYAAGATPYWVQEFGAQF